VADIEQSIKQRDALDNIFLAGPLHLNKKTKQAGTVMGAKLYLNENEFDALHMIAVLEGEAITFEQLYAAIWGVGDSPDSREKALKSLEKVSEQVETAGQGFMWIELKPECGYIFHTRWAHNRQTLKDIVTPTAKKRSPAKGRNSL